MRKDLRSHAGRGLQLYSLVMSPWTPIRSIPVGGVVAVGFLDERHVVVGSHNGLGVLDTGWGLVLARDPDPGGDYEWFLGDPPRARFVDDRGDHVIAVAGLWGGSLPGLTSDGSVCRATARGAALTGHDGTVVSVDDGDEIRALGFSPEGSVFVFATSATIYWANRTST